MDLRKRPRKKSDPVRYDLEYDTLDRGRRAASHADVSLEVNLYILAGITVLSLIVRLFRISHPSEVVFDEVHFGGFGSKYLRGEFFMDVHPPLGKLLVAASGVLGGYNGSFSFKEIGLDYTEPRVPYVMMRLLPGLLGSLLVPASYITMRNFGYTNQASVLTAMMLLFENGFVTQSRLILLDSPLVFFSGLAVMMWSDFLANQDSPFTFTWWYPLAMTGVFLGLAVSVKWVGLFVIATVGTSTLLNLWAILGDTQVSYQEFGRHFAARALCLMIVPFTIYAALFQIHFWALPHTGTGTGFMSPEFQSTLRGNEIVDTYIDVAYGSNVYIRHDATSGGYLHSHKLNYPTGSKQQQITLYPFRDQNSLFVIKLPLQNVNGSFQDLPITTLQKIKHNDIIRLEHVETKKRLHSHDHRAPVTDNEHNNEVSGYGEVNFAGDTNDHWRVEVVDVEEKDPFVKSIHTKFRLVHVNSWCKLFSHSVKLPDWAHGQQEVMCAKNGRKSHTIWRIEHNTNPLLPADAKRTNYRKPGFWKKLFELHRVMWKTNSGLRSSHPFDSRPDAWPFLRRGISFWTAKHGASGQIYLIGNPIVWWSASLCVFSYASMALANIILEKRQISMFDPGFGAQAFNGCLILFSGWFYHYFPFFLMKRQLFLHHYFPALYFSILLTGALFDLATYKIKPKTRWLVVGILCFIVFWVFWDLSPLSYGFSMSRKRCERIKWRSHWDWSCLSSPQDTHARMPAPAEVKHEKDHPMSKAVTP